MLTYALFFFLDSFDGKRRVDITKELLKLTACYDDIGFEPVALPTSELGNGKPFAMEIINTDNPRVSARQISEEIGINTRNVQNHIKSLKNLGLIERIGSPKSGHWVVKKPGTKYG